MPGVICSCQIIGGSSQLGNKKARKESNSIKDEIILAMQTKGKIVQSQREDVKLEGKALEKKIKLAWTQVKEFFKKGSGEKRLEQYSKNDIQIEICKKQDKECDICLEQN